MSFSLITFHHLIHATKYSLMGLIQAFKSEQSFRHEVIILGILFFLLWFQDKNALHWLITISGWLFVMIIELLNSAIEKIFDLITTDIKPIIKAGKDMASAAIFLAIIINIGLWFYLFTLPF